VLAGNAAPLSVTTSADAAQATYSISPTGAGMWTQVASSSTGTPFSATVDTTSLADGAYDVQAVVADQFGNTTSVVTSNVRVDNTAPTTISTSPADGSVLSSVGSMSLTASENLSAVNSLRLDGVVPAFATSISGATATFNVGSLSPGNHALTGRIVDAGGLSTPFRLNLTIPSGTGDVAETTKNVSSVVPTTLGAADDSATVTVPANIWQQPVPGPQDFLVLHVDPTPPAMGIQGSLQFASTPLDVWMTWNLAGSQEHHFDAPLEIVLTDSTGGSGYPVTFENSAWRAIQLLDAPGVLPASWEDGYWRDHGSVHILTRHLSMFALVNSIIGVQLAPPHDFAGTVAADGLTLRWAPGMANEQIANFSLYVDGQLFKKFGQREFETKLGPISAAADHRYTLTESSLAGSESTASPALRVVPPLGGLSLDAATAALQARAFTVGKLVQVSNPSVPAGTVVGPTDVRVLPEGTAVDLQVATNGVARSPLLFTVSLAPRVAVAQRTLAARVLLSGRARIDVTLDAKPFRRIQRWHYTQARAGATIVPLKLRQTLSPGSYRLFWKATSLADGSIERRITRLQVVGSSRVHAALTPQIVVIGSSAQTVASQPHAHVVRLTSEEAYLYATSHDVSVIVLDIDPDRMQLLKALRTVFPSTAVIAFSKDPAKLAVAAKAGAIAIPRSTSAAKLRVLIADILAANRARG
jgi:hypothetical protein